MRYSFTTIFLILGFSISIAQNGTFGTSQSALKDGDIFKIAVKETGIFKLDYNFLKNDLKINNLDQIDPRTIKIFGNGGGMLSEIIADERPDDLIENSIQIAGEEDGKFDAGDYILFYAIGPDKWIFDKKRLEFHRPKNIYSNESFYFIKINNGNGKRITQQNNLQNTAYTSTIFDDFIRFEEDKTNILASNNCNCTEGSGKTWYGDVFTALFKEKSYSDKFTFPNIANEDAKLFAGFAHTTTNGLNLTITTGSKNIARSLFSYVPSTASESSAALVENFSEVFTPQKDNIDVKIAHNGGGIVQLWLDFIEINARRKLIMTGTQMSFRDIKSIGKVSTTFQISNFNNNLAIWDITNPQNPLNQAYVFNANQANFGVSTEGGTLKEFITFDKNAALLKPTPIGKIANQNLHAFDNIDLLIVYHKDFEKAAQKLAEHRRSKSGFAVAIAETGQIFNEFSSGALDPTAIRDFSRLLHKRSARFKYLLLLGDGSFDYKKIYPLGNIQASDFVPVYETNSSLDPINSFPSDDYFALLSDNEGGDLYGSLDIAVGRIPCKTASEAEGVVNKIIRYESPSSFGNWRTRSTFMSDNGDGNTHLNDADYIANIVTTNHSNLNIDKIHMDAYQLEVSAGGTRVPDMNEAIYRTQYNGTLTLCYLGHGGPRGISQERVLMREDLNNWQNIDRLPLIVTATCSFSSYDNYKEISAGEVAILNPNGGAIGLFSTVRAVYADRNAYLTQSVFDTIFGKTNARFQTLGEILMNAKNSSTTGENGNKFTLIGDPSMRLAIPRYNVATTNINGKSANLQSDTVRALQKVTVEGTITDENGGILTGFNGTIFPTVYDKTATLRTLGQAGSSARDFTVQRNILFKGAATVKNGAWKFSFTIPKDIDYSFGKGKISYYATDNTVDAAGSYEGLYIGGSDPSVAADNLPPVVQVFINDDKFISGGTTDANPTVYIKLSDDNGINVAGTSIGHDLSGYLDDNQNVIVLNNFYEAVKDDATKGIVKYPLSNLSEGKHIIRVKAWDISNNPGEGTIEFIVASDLKGAISELMNYPNPFAKETSFRFKHSVNGQSLKVTINIYALDGRLVKTIQQDISNAGTVDNIVWDGLADGGTIPAKGMYVFEAIITGQNAKGESISTKSTTQKLVIMK